MSAQKQASAMPDWMREHIELYRTDPEKAHMLDAGFGSPDLKGHRIPTLLLMTKGRKTGKTHFTPLTYGKIDGGFAIVASKAGDPNHPAWFLNLQADPDVEIQVAAKHYHARARVAGPEERKKLWSEMIKIFPPYDDYQAGSERQIPVVVLEPKATRP